MKRIEGFCENLQFKLIKNIVFGVGTFLLNEAIYSNGSGSGFLKPRFGSAKNPDPQIDKKTRIYMDPDPKH